MSNQLQRSSVSFRRQGSSGRIWEDPTRNPDLKGGALLHTLSTASPHSPKHEKEEEEKVQSNHGRSIEKSKRSCGFSAMFSPCIRPNPSVNPTS